MSIEPVVALRRSEYPGPVFDASKVDLVTLDPNSDVVSLYIVATEDWTGVDEQLVSLQQKIHNYVSYALDGQMSRAITPRLQEFSGAS
jgi:hypothetical protein